MTKPDIMIPDELKQKATELILPPSPVKKIGEIMTSPLKTIATVQGQVKKVCEFSSKGVNIKKRERILDMREKFFKAKKEGFYTLYYSY